MIGCGAVTEVKSGPAYNISGKSKLVGVTSRTISSAQNYARRHNVPIVFNDINTLINSSEIDAVYIATPPATHLNIAKRVAEAGKPCCIEKPIAVNFSEASDIVKAFEEQKLPLFIAYYRRSLPRFQTIKSLLEDNRIGEVRHIHWSLTRPPRPEDVTGDLSWRTDARQAPGGYFDDLACHGLDLFDYYFGQIVKVKGHALNQQALYKVPDAFSASWIHEDGLTGSGFWNFGASDRYDEVRIFGAKGNIRFSMFNNESIECETINGVEILDIDHPKHLHEFHVQNIISHLEGHMVHPSTGESALRTSWVCEQILKSSDI